MQEKQNADLRASPWELYVFEEGGWVLVDSFGSEDEARASLNAVLARTGVQADFYTLIGPEDKVMPPAPASYKA